MQLRVMPEQGGLRREIPEKERAAVSAKKAKRVAKLKEMGSDDYALRRCQRNGVEAIPSLLRRKCNADGIPVMGGSCGACSSSASKSTPSTLKSSLNAQGESAPMRHLRASAPKCGKKRKSCPHYPQYGSVFRHL
jgi:hypothetical protein